MEHVLDNGGVVAFDGEVIRHKKDLPSSAVLSKGDPIAARQAREDLLLQKALIEEQLQELEEDDTPKEVDPPKENDPPKEVEPPAKPVRDPSTGKPVVAP
jgi:hypothetical protein